MGPRRSRTPQFVDARERALADAVDAGDVALSSLLLDPKHALNRARALAQQHLATPNRSMGVQTEDRSSTLDPAAARAAAMLRHPSSQRVTTGRPTLRLLRDAPPRIAVPDVITYVEPEDPDGT